MVTCNKPSHIIGLWRGASGVVQICPYCPRIITEHTLDDFREMLGNTPSEEYAPMCPLCRYVGFAYFEHPGEREWTHDGARHSFRFVGWDDPIFIQKIAHLYDAKTIAYQNIKSLIETGF